MDQSPTHDAKGRFIKGRSGNPAGRPRGIKNRPRQQDTASAAAWPRSMWRLFYRQALHTAHGNTDAAMLQTAELYIILLEAAAALKRLLGEKWPT